MDDIDYNTVSQAYLDNLEIPSLSLAQIQHLQNEFQSKFFLPWSITSSNLDYYLKHDLIPGKGSSYAGDSYKGNDNTWYGENKDKHRESEKNRIANNASFNKFPNFFRQGITTQNTDLRRLPTNKPGFDTYSKAGEGYPFDYFQETSIWANTPILLLHLSKDKQWVYGMTSFYKGWIPVSDIAIVNEDFINTWTKGNYNFVLSDTITVESIEGFNSVNAKIGMVLPLIKEDEGSKNTVYFAISDENKNAILRKGKVPKKNTSNGFIELSEANLKLLVSEMLGQPYGWGGSLGNRDCSATIKDFLTPFGIWLPRNSGAQATYGDSIGGSNIDFTSMSSISQDSVENYRENKVKSILDNGVPFLTIIEKGGHSMLYAGKNRDGEPLILHTIWGLRTNYSDSLLLRKVLNEFPIEGIHENYDKTAKKYTGSFQGRKLIGKTILSTLEFDKNYSDLNSRLVDDIRRMTILVSRKD